MPEIVPTNLADPMPAPAPPDVLADPLPPPALPTRPTDDLVSHALTDGWRSLRASPSRLVVWRLATWLVEAIPWIVWGAAYFRLVTDTFSALGDGRAEAGFFRGVGPASLQLASVGLVLWVITHLARGVYTAVALDAQRGTKRALGGWFMRRGPALLGWGLIDAGLLAAAAALTTIAVTRLRPLLDTAWLAAGFPARGATAQAPALPSLPWGAAIGVSVLTTVAAAVLITLPFVAIWATWARLQLIPWRLADDATGLRAAVADSWRWMPGHRTAWWAMFVGWGAVWIAVVWIPVLGALAASLLGWSWTAAFYERVRVASLDTHLSAPIAVPAAPARWPWLDATLVGIAAAWFPFAGASVAAIASGTVFVARAATLAKELPYAIGLPGVLYALSLPVAAIVCGTILWRCLGRSAVWPGRHGWSRNRVITGLVAVIVGLQIGYVLYGWGGGIAGWFDTARSQSYTGAATSAPATGPTQ
jgi:hypothetical protein